MTATDETPRTDGSRHTSCTGLRAREAAALVALTLLVVIARRPDLIAAPQFWAEDAAVFYAHAELHGTTTIRLPFSGYLWLYPRLVALAGMALPVRQLPVLYTMASLGFTAVALWFVARSPLTGSRGAMAAMLAAVAIAPFSDEIWGNLPNSHWFSALAILAACVPPRDERHARRQAVALPVFALTGPSALVLLPVAVVSTTLRRDRWRWIMLAVVCIGAAATVWAMTVHPRQHGGETLVDRWWSLVSLAMHRKPLQAFIAAAAVVVVLTWSAWRARHLPSIAFGLTVLSFAGAACISAPLEAIYALPGAAGRYVFVPWVAMSWLVIAALLRGRTTLAAIAAIAMVGLAAWRFPLPPRPTVDWPSAAACLERERACHVHVTPYPSPIVLPGRGLR